MHGVSCPSVLAEYRHISTSESGPSDGLRVLLLWPTNARTKRFYNKGLQEIHVGLGVPLFCKEKRWLG